MRGIPVPRKALRLGLSVARTTRAEVPAGLARDARQKPLMPLEASLRSRRIAATPSWRKRPRNAEAEPRRPKA
jgi:hypothetical protein